CSAAASLDQVRAPGHEQVPRLNRKRDAGHELRGVADEVRRRICYDLRLEPASRAEHTESPAHHVALFHGATLVTGDHVERPLPRVLGSVDDTWQDTVHPY